jgi:hypothetical protein
MGLVEGYKVDIYKIRKVYDIEDCVYPYEKIDAIARLLRDQYDMELYLCKDVDEGSFMVLSPGTDSPQLPMGWDDFLTFGTYHEAP